MIVLGTFNSNKHSDYQVEDFIFCSDCECDERGSVPNTHCDQASQCQCKVRGDAY